MATLPELLAQLDLSKFAPALVAEDIDIDVARTLSEDELAKLGLTLGARKKLYFALHPSGVVASVSASAAAPPPPPKSPCVSKPMPPPPTGQKNPALSPAPTAVSMSRSTPTSLAPPLAPAAKKSGVGSKCHPAASYSCAYGHAMEVVTRSSFRCDKCAAKGFAYTTRWCCVECNFDMCHTCAPLPAEGAAPKAPPTPLLKAPPARTLVAKQPASVSAAGTPPGKAEIVKPPAALSVTSTPIKPSAATPSASYACTVGHNMEVVTRGSFRCDKCSARGFDYTTRWCCIECNFDMCHACAPLPAEGAGTASPKAPPTPLLKSLPPKALPTTLAVKSPILSASSTCDKGHALAIGTDDPHYMCYGCYTPTNDPKLATRWRCAECSYDMCHACAPISSVGNNASPLPSAVNNAVPAQAAGPITPLKEPSVINPGFNVLHCGRDDCNMFLQPAKRRGGCTVCKTTDPSPLNSTMGMSVQQAYSAMRSAPMDAPPAIGTRLVCMREGCGWSICASCDASSAPDSKLCGRCLAWFAAADLGAHRETCLYFTCTNPDCSRVFNQKAERDAHTWACTREIVYAMLKKAVGRGDNSGSDEDNNRPSYSSPSSSHSAPSQPRPPKPAKAPKEKKVCSRCKGAQRIKCERCGGTGKAGSKACSLCHGARTLPCPKIH